MRSILIVAALLVATPVFAQQPDSYNPGRVGDQSVEAPAPQKPATDYRADAQKQLAEWQQSRRDCFTKAGLVEGKDWRFRKNNPTKTQINDQYWLSGRPDPNCQ